MPKYVQFKVRGLTAKDIRIEKVQYMYNPQRV